MLLSTILEYVNVYFILLICLILFYLFVLYWSIICITWLLSTDEYIFYIIKESYIKYEKWVLIKKQNMKKQWWISKSQEFKQYG